MAFLTYNNDSSWRRKRSTSATRDGPSTNIGKAVDEPLHKRSRSLSASPSSTRTPESPELAPPLPTPITAGLRFRPRTARTREASPSSYDQSSTPIPFTRPNKRVSPPPFSSLIIDVQRRNSVDVEQSQSPRGTVVDRPTSHRAAPSSPSASYSIPSPPNSTPVRPEDMSADTHPVPAPKAKTPELISLSVTPERQQPGFSQRMAAVLPLKLPHTPARKRNSKTVPVALPTPVSPQGQRAARPEPISVFSASPMGQIHARSRSATNSPTTYSSGSGPGSAKSSARRVPTPIVGQYPAGAASGPASASASGTSTPTHEPTASQPQEKRSRNVLRKRSITSGTRRREPESAPASDNEKKVRTHHPRSRSVAFSPRRNSSGPILDVSHPLPAKPVTVVDLTPAKEILVAYKESHRDSFSKDTTVPVAAGSEGNSSAGSSKSPWSTELRRERKDKMSADERNVYEKSGVGTAVGTLRRKLSGKRSGKEPSRRDEPTRSVSGSAVEGPERKLTRDMEGNRSATFSNDTWVGASHGREHSPERGRQPGQEEGRVWEEDVGNWVGKHLRGTETEKDLSNSRRLWRLVKRLSSGNLREKSSSPLEAPPPVPPLPKDLASKQPEMSPGRTDDFKAIEMPIPQSAVPETPAGIRRYISSVPSVSIPHTSAGLPIAQSRMAAIHRSVPATSTTPHMRPSTTTRSSSPASETTKFFSRSRSSSSSSYGDATAPPMPSMPSAHPGKQVASPREYTNSHNEKGEDNVAMERSPSVKASTHLSADTSDESSASIPSFEAHNPVNKFLPYRGRRPSVSPSLASHFPDHEPVAPRTEQAKRTNPPPIPRRNPRRPGHHSLSIPSLPLPVLQHSMPNVIPVQDASEAVDGDALRTERRRDWGKTPTVSKPRPRSISDGAIIPEPERYALTAKSTSVTFREMTTAKRQLTEQEKTAKWEDLLQRSDKAGGTLHVRSPTTGGLGLWSDRSSVALSETLDSTDQD